MMRGVRARGCAQSGARPFFGRSPRARGGVMGWRGDVPRLERAWCRGGGCATACGAARRRARRAGGGEGRGSRV
eukprot:4453256-Prymnesium_polylepis.1